MNEPNLKVPVCEGCGCQDPTTRCGIYHMRLCFGCELYLCELENHGKWYIADARADSVGDLHWKDGVA